MIIFSNRKSLGFVSLAIFMSIYFICVSDAFAQNNNFQKISPILAIKNKIKRPQSVELILKYNHLTKTMELVSQRFRDVPAPRNRGTKATTSGQLIFQCENQAGGVLASFPINDPTYLRSEGLSQVSSSEENLLEGDHSQIPESTFMVVVPFDEHLANVRLFKPLSNLSGFSTKNGSPGMKEMVGLCPLNRNAIRAVLKNK